MAANGTTTHVIRGRLDWAKVLGAPILNTYSEEKEWSVDVTPDDKSKAEAKRLGMKLRTPKGNDKRKEDFLSFRQREFRNDPKTGEKVKNDPIHVVDVKGEPWDPSAKIGNGSVADVKFTKRDYGVGKPKGFYIKAIRVLEHVSYETQEFAPLSADDEFFASPEDNLAAPDSSDDAAVDDLDDDIPF